MCSHGRFINICYYQIKNRELWKKCLVSLRKNPPSHIFLHVFFAFIFSERITIIFYEEDLKVPDHNFFQEISTLHNFVWSTFYKSNKNENSYHFLQDLFKNIAGSEMTIFRHKVVTLFLTCFGNFKYLEVEEWGLPCTFLIEFLWWWWW